MTDRQSDEPVILFLTAGGFNPWMIANRLAARFPGLQIILEEPESKRTLLRRRARRFGWLSAFGQLATMIVSRLGKRFTTRRSEEIAREYGLSGTLDPGIPLRQVGDINDPETVALIAALKPDVIATVSCRILRKTTLAALSCPIINLHSGINPAYRGQMGGYWSLVSGDRDNFGATVHLVDEGIDTGRTLYQARTAPSPSDSMWTYPTLLTAISADAVERAVADALEDRLTPVETAGPSKLWFNVPIWTWLFHGLTKGIW